MDAFLCTKSTIGEGMGMGSYSPSHVLWLAAGALYIAIVSRLYARGGEESRRTIRILVALLVLADEALKYLVTIPTGQWEWSFLPLHLCSISVFVIALHAFHPDDRVAEYLYAVSLPTALMALVFPNWMMLPCWNWESIHSFTIHILIVSYPVMLLCGGFRPCFRRLVYSFPFLAVAVVVAVVANRFLDTNFLFLNSGDEGNPLSFLEKLVGGWYVLAFPLIAALVWSIMYLVPRRLKWS